MQKIKQSVIRVIYCLAAVISIFCLMTKTHDVSAASCPDLKIIFARGSGAERYNNADYQSFKSSLESKLKTSNLTYEFNDLDYPAVSVGSDNILVALGALFSGGESYTFGDSVRQGISKLSSIVNDSTCKNTKYVVAGYSQGAMVVSGGLEKLNPNQLIYAATFGDPKIYLPEGAGAVPIACKGEGLSDYRIYVPDCRAYKGLLGAKEPYATSDYLGKLGTWCNKFDIFCSSHSSITSHTSYESDNLYEDASKLIFSKIAAHFDFKNEYTSPHDTAILIDSTGSMKNLINQYKSEAYELAQKTLDTGGRVALYDYRDLAEGYQPIERCNFETCTLETFQQGLSSITAANGGDAPESLLSASFQIMQKLSWQLGSTKSLVILTDSGYHSPDLDDTTFYDVVSLSKQIDPVNFYIITKPGKMETYQSLANATGGAVVSSASELNLLTDTIMERFDSLPRVEEEPENQNQIKPHLEITETNTVSDTEYTISFNTNGTKTVVILNDAILGVTDHNKFTIVGLRGVSNTLTLVPLSTNLRGDPVSVELKSGSISNQTTEPLAKFVIPKAPNTGKR